jgi:hypothetical protein
VAGDCEYCSQEGGKTKDPPTVQPTGTEFRLNDPLPPDDGMFSVAGLNENTQFGEF